MEASIIDYEKTRAMFDSLHRSIVRTYTRVTCGCVCSLHSESGSGEDTDGSRPRRMQIRKCLIFVRE